MVSASTGKKPQVAPYSGRHVGDGGAIFHREVVEAGAVIFDELLDHAALAQHLRAGEHEIGGGHAFLELALEAEADHLGDHHGDGLAQHGGLRLDAAHAPAEHAQRIHHRGVAVGAHAGVGERLIELAADLVHTVCARYSRLTWWQMPVPGGTTRKLLKAPAPQRRNS